ncbi:hypothetical protein C7974DRAFT_472395 [Boeremia exigua]|uniref:uncharacterized protein n=1 Tax=Boeremia exigua TaxID=749465 RepID=UPI001E8E98F3|nr:uncharacterized protein C7974DRAFT_472395 [Boeremia exigua]KAH6629654.1 hypothetical protein C7974DRAFT_472395 [Boeremia exigua]
MSTPTPQPQVLAFFGATGGVCATTLALALHAGHTCTALARTPQKLTDLLRTAHAVPAAALESLLTIHAGDVKDPAACAAALVSPLNPAALVDTIVFGVGAAPVLSWIPPFIGMTDATVCETGTAAIFSALDDLAARGIATAPAGSKPLFISISTTGLSTKTRDVPLLLYPLYKLALHTPHLDKSRAETLLTRDAGVHIRDCVVVRPTLLTDAPRKGIQGVRAGWEWTGPERERGGVREAGPQLGWSIGRKDVGGWVFERVVQEGGWEGRCVSLTY